MQRKKKILIIDDEPDFVQLLTTRLELEGYQVISASDGTEGAVVAKTQAPDLITVDLMMPGIDGYETCEKIRKAIYPRAVPVIVITAKDRTEDELLAYKVGVKFFLKKPYDHNVLLKMIKKALGEEEQQQRPLQANIIIIEPDAAVLKALELKLRNAGFGVINTSSVTEGWKSSKMEKPDVVIVDGLSSRTDYHNALWDFRYDQRLKKTAFIVTAPTEQLADLRKELELFEISDYVAKPFDGRKLIDSIATVLRKSQ